MPEIAQPKCKSFMISLRKSGDGDDGKFGPPRYIGFDEGGQQVIFNATTWRKAILSSLSRDGSGVPKGDLLFFVHGYNVSFDASCQSNIANAEQLRQFNWPGVFVGFDWPSFGLAVPGYPWDKSNALHALPQFINLALAPFVAQSAPDCAVRVSIMTHSMGALLLREALIWASKHPLTNTKDWSVSQLIMVAPDVAAASLGRDQPGGGAIDHYVGRTTVYYNRFDAVLQVSDVKNGDPTDRAGRVGLTAAAPKSFCQVDTSDLFRARYQLIQTALNVALPHCYYFNQPEFWQDVVLTLLGGIDRHAIPTRTDVTPPSGPDSFKLQTVVQAPPQYDQAVQIAGLGR